MRGPGAGSDAAAAQPTNEGGNTANPRNAAVRDVLGRNSPEEARKREALIQCLAGYLKRTSNLKVTTHVRSYFTQLEDMTPKSGAAKDRLLDLDIEYRRIAESFWYKIRSRPDNRPQPDAREIDEAAGYDAESGIQREVRKTAERGEPGGYCGSISTLDNTFSIFAMHERYGRFFDGVYTETGNFYIPNLLDHQNEMSFEPSSRPGLVQVVVNNYKIRNLWGPGTARMWFDPARNFLLTRVEEDFPTKHGGLRHAADVTRARRVQGAWLPERIVEIYVWPGRQQPGTGDVYEVELQDAQLDTLTKKDLELVFPKNLVHVDDRIQRKQWSR